MLVGKILKGKRCMKEERGKGVGRGEKERGGGRRITSEKGKGRTRKGEELHRKVVEGRRRRMKLTRRDKSDVREGGEEGERARRGAICL